MNASRCHLSIILVSWNVWDLLRACLHSIEAASRPLADQPLRRTFGPHPDFGFSLEVIVVDNASQDHTPQLLASRFPWVQVVTNDQNLGFTRANNQGYSHSQGEAVLFLNPDTSLAPDVLTLLYQTLHSDPTIGVVAPRLRYGDGTIQGNRRRFPAPLTGFFESTWLAQIWPGNPWRRRYLMLDWPDDFPQDVDWVVGAAMLVRRQVLEMVGGFDEAFFMYSEEMDLCRRIRQAGWRVRYQPAATVIHYEGKSSEQAVAARHIHFNTSKVRYARKHHGPLVAEILRRYLLAEFWVQLWLEGIKKRVGHKVTLRQARIEAYQAVLHSHLQ